MSSQTYVVAGDAALLINADGSRKYLHYVDSNIVSKVLTGAVTTDGTADAVYQYGWGGFALVDYRPDGTLSHIGLNPALPLPRLSGDYALTLDGTADVMGGDGAEVIFRLDYGLDADRGTIHYAYDHATGAVKTLLTAAGGAEVQGFGDLDGNGKADVVYTDAAGGLHVQLDGGRDVALSQVTADPAVSVAAVADFHDDGAGLDEVLFFNRDTRAFDVWVKGPAGADSGAMGGVDYLKTVFTLPDAWSFLGAGDYDGDGTADLLIGLVSDTGRHAAGARSPLAFWSVGQETLVELGAHEAGLIAGPIEVAGTDGGRLMPGAVVPVGVDPGLV
ncbi:MAG TPA: hypothetical protein VEB20_08050 [Azospirillaceae bacterium]|nr:hypothetical protein [Azospirillaceae bacterium]